MTTPSAGALSLVEHLRRHVTDDERVLDAILHTPREEFVPPGVRPYAYEDTALPLEAGQTISQPTIVAMMTAALRLEGDERVLEVGTGSGYQAAVLALLCAQVVSVEVVDSLRESAHDRLQTLGITNVTALPATDEIGAPDLGPYDAIIVTAAAPEVPPPLLDQLAPGGRLVIPVGSREEQELQRVTRDIEGGVTSEDLGACRFVPLTGPHGFGGGGA
ncbi:MAG: protein-L-isoaspartate(D-aspartate) O-methyltransferase [Dehalococcoidia bacterium]